VTADGGERTIECPVGRSVDVIGEWWSILIVRDAMEGITRFDDFRRHLGISPTMLTQRLRRLVETGILRRRPYESRPPRDEYVLTDRGRALAAALLALAGWWNDAVDPEERPVIVVDHQTGEEAEPTVVDRRTGQPIAWPRHRFAPGPIASDRVRDLLAAHDPDLAAS
jgi:DNA-binding HxlR family transcriptional regulator